MDSGTVEKIRIVVIESDREAAKILQILLKKMFGEDLVEIKMATTAKEGIKLISKGKKPDLVITCLGLPTVENGYLMINFIRDRLYTKEEMPILAITGANAPISPQGINAILTEPSSEEIILKTVVAMIYHRG